MSDKLNEKFEEFATEQKVTIVEGDPMPTVSANVIPGTGSEPSQVSDAQTSNGGGKDPMPTVDAGKSYGQSAPADLGGTSTTPNEHDDDGDVALPTPPSEGLLHRGRIVIARAPVRHREVVWRHLASQLLHE